MKRAGSFILVLGTIVLAIEALVRTGALNPVYFPAPSTVLRTLGGMTVTGSFWSTVSSTVGAMSVGFLLAIAIAIPVGTLMGQSPPARLLMEPIVDSLRPMPSAAVIPVAILLLGLGSAMKTGVIIFGSLWPPIISTMDGIRGVDPILVDTGRLLGLRGSALLRRVMIPAALPSILTGIRISLGIALILTVTTEMIAGTSGLGYLILDAQRSFAFAEMFAGILALGILGYVLTVAFSIVERRLLFWHSSVRRETVDNAVVDAPSDTITGLDATGTVARAKRADLNRRYSLGDLKDQIPIRFLSDARHIMWIGMDGPRFARRILESVKRSDHRADFRLTVVHWRPLALKELRASLAHDFAAHSGSVEVRQWHPSLSGLPAGDDERFDLIGITYTLHDLSTTQADELLHAAASLLSDNGRVLVATHAKTSFPELLAVYRAAARNCGLAKLEQRELSHFDSFPQEGAEDRLRQVFANVERIDIDTSLRCGADGLDAYLQYASIFPFPGLTELSSQERERLWTAFQREAAMLNDYTITKPSAVFVCSAATAGSVMAAES